MLDKSKWTFLFWSVFFGVLHSQQLYAVCKDHPGQIDLDGQKGAGITEVVFFASWCASCVKHLQEADPKKSLVIAVFDEQNAAEQAFDAVFKNKPGPACIFDSKGDLARQFAISGLPHRRQINQ